MSKKFSIKDSYIEQQRRGKMEVGVIVTIVSGVEAIDRKNG
jgi:hypothetical protein